MSSDEGLLVLCVLMLLFVIIYFIINNKTKQPSAYVPVPEPYCLHSKYGCCPLSPNPREDAYGTNC